jgi:hypothetical protein
MMFDFLKKRRKRRKPVDPATRLGREVGKVAGAAATGILIGIVRKILKK